MLSERRELLPPMFDDLRVGITVHDPNTGEILDVNERLEELYGYPAEELRQMDVEEYTAPSTRFTQQKALEQIRAAADGDSREFEWQVERANGDVRWVRVHLQPTTIDGRSVVVAEVSEITEYRKREQRLRLLSRIVRHNLRNKMTVVRGHAEQLEVALDDPGQSVEKIRATAADVGGLSESVSQLEEIADSDTTDRSPRSLARVAHSAIEEARRDYPDADLSVDVRSDPAVIADNGVDYALEQAIENAVVHNTRETPTVTVTTDTEDDHGVLQVVDDGPPIPSVETDVLEDDVETSSTYHGTGVGLWVMQWCLSALGGELTFERDEHRGNVVSMALPKATQF